MKCINNNNRWSVHIYHTITKFRLFIHLFTKSWCQIFISKLDFVLIVNSTEKIVIWYLQLKCTRLVNNFEGQNILIGLTPTCVLFRVSRWYYSFSLGLSPWNEDSTIWMRKCANTLCMVNHSLRKCISNGKTAHKFIYDHICYIIAVWCTLSVAHIYTIQSLRFMSSFYLLIHRLFQLSYIRMEHDDRHKFMKNNWNLFKGKHITSAVLPFFICLLYFLFLLYHRHRKQNWSLQWSSFHWIR